MKIRILATLLVAGAMAAVWQSAEAQHAHKLFHSRPAKCDPGHQIVEEIIEQDVERVVCRMVPDPKKKWVYDWIYDPFCIQSSKHGECPNCAGPFCRKQLVKKQIDDPHPHFKCVTERIVERVQVKVYRMVPCTELPPGTVTPSTAPPKVETIPTRPLPVGGPK